MQAITDLQQIQKLKAEGALFILFGGPHCNVCQALKPRLDELIEQHYPLMKRVYVDCEQAPDICAQFRVFTLPSIKVYIEGMLITEDSRAFGLQELSQRIQRSYDLWADQSGP